MDLVYKKRIAALGEKTLFWERYFISARSLSSFEMFLADFFAVFMIQPEFAKEKDKEMFDLLEESSRAMPQVASWSGSELPDNFSALLKERINNLPEAKEDGVRFLTPEPYYLSDYFWRAADWVFYRKPDEGWKLYVSAAPEQAISVLSLVLPILIEEKAQHKVANGQEAIKKLYADSTQPGKFIVIYPMNKAHAQRIAARLDKVLANKGFSGPSVPTANDLRSHGGISGLIYYAYVPLERGYFITPEGEEVYRARIVGEWRPAWITEDLFDRAIGDSVSADLGDDINASIADSSFPPEAILDKQGSGGVDPSASSGLIPQREKPGGIDFRALPIVTQRAPNLGTVPVLPAGRPLGIQAKPLAGTVPVDLAKEWQQIQNMLKGGIIPSTERIKDYLNACCGNGCLDGEIEKVLSCIADILRLEEERVIATEPDLKELLVLLESDKPEQEIVQVLSAVEP
jgi:hypothetical protein